MDKKKVLSLLLCAVMLISALPSMAAFAEDDAEEVAAEPENDVYIIQATEEGTEPEEAVIVAQADTAESAEIVAEANAEITAEANAEIVAEASAAEAAAPFAEGYVLVKKETVTYASASFASAVGSFADDAVAYAVMAERAEDENASWLQVNFHAGEEELQKAYVQFGNVTVLSDEDVAELRQTWANARVETLDFENKPLPLVSFTKKEEAALEDEMVSAAVPTVTVTPAIAKARSDEKISFHAQVENAEGEVSYQWQNSPKDTEKWNSFSSLGGKTDTITLQATDARLGLKYRCIVTVNGVKYTSDAVWFERPAVVDLFVIDDVTFRILDDSSVEVAAYTGTAASLVVPGEVSHLDKTYTVTAIGEEAFMGNTSLTAINLPNSIEVIKARAFKNCSNLSQMTNS